MGQALVVDVQKHVVRRDLGVQASAGCEIPRTLQCDLVEGTQPDLGGRTHHADALVARDGLDLDSPSGKDAAGRGVGVHTADSQVRRTADRDDR